MPAIATPPVPSSRSVPRPLRWTVADFHRAASTGVFEGRRPVLIHGVLLEQGTMNPPHAIAIDLVTEAFRVTFGTRLAIPRTVTTSCWVSIPIRCPISRWLPAMRADFATTHPTTAALVVEVSDTTLALDLTEKAELYATAGIADYWVLDLEARRLLVFRDPGSLPDGARAYRTHLTLGPSDSVSPLAAPGATICVKQLLP